MNETQKITVQNLLTVKSIVTIMLTITFVYLSIIGKVSGEQFMTIFTVVVSFYFGSQFEKNRNKDDEASVTNIFQTKED